MDLASELQQATYSRQTVKPVQEAPPLQYLRDDQWHQQLRHKKTFLFLK